MRPPEYQSNERRSDHEQFEPVHETDISSSTIGAVRRAYRDASVNSDVDTDGTRRLNFHSCWRDASDTDLPVALGYIGPYNGFDPDAIDLSALPEGTQVSIARESSPAIYLWTEDPYNAVRSIQSMCPPDELSVRSQAREYPNAEPEFSNSIWVDTDDIDLLRTIKTPALIRCWWD